MTKETDYRLGHRTRLREKFLDGKFTEAELLELLLTYAIPRIDVKPIVRELLKKFRGTREILIAPLEKLMAIPGLGANTAIFIKAVHESMLIGFKSHMASVPVFHDLYVLESYCQTLLANKATEEFHVLYLDSGYKLIEDHLHSNGTIDWSAVYPREVVKRAITLNAKIAILIHNHPSGNSSFSNEDIKITHEIRDMLKVMDVTLFDHFLVANGLVYSARNLYLLK